MFGERELHRLRASVRGFLLPRLNVPSVLDDRAKVQVNCLTPHHQLNAASGQSHTHHFAVHAALSERGVIGELAFKLAHRLIKLANSASSRGLA